MDPVSAVGLALGVASVAVQIYSGCIEGIQLLITATNYPQDCAYLNLRLRMEQQRLFAWSETSGLLEFADKGAAAKIHASNTFSTHRTTILDLLLQVQILFKEFAEHQRRHGGLRTATDPDDELCRPEADARAANFPLPARRRDYIKRVMGHLKARSDEGMTRLRWVSFDKDAFETLLGRFASLNDAMMDMLDMQLQVEIRDTVQDTNRGVLQLHHRISDLGRLVMALNLKLETGDHPSITGTGGDGGGAVASRSLPVVGSMSEMSRQQRAANAQNLEQLSKLAKFKAFNASMNGEESGGQSASASASASASDHATVQFLELLRPDQGKNLQLSRDDVELEPEPADEDGDDDPDAPRCEAFLRTADGTRTRVWVEWKDYDDGQQPTDHQSPPKQVIFERVSRLAALLNHTPKPEAFRTPHCIGFFDKASQPRGGPPASPSSQHSSFSSDVLDHRLGLVFARPVSADLHDSLPPVSLRSLLLAAAKPSVTARVQLAHAIASCLVYLHAVNWLHKGLRSHNIVFFRARDGQSIDFAAPYLSGFDFSRPARPEEETDMPGDDAEHNLYRHPLAQTSSAVSLARLARQAPQQPAGNAGHGNSDGNGDGNGNGNGDGDATTAESRQRFKKSFDIYGLGVLLVEIAHWETIDAVLGIDVARARARGRTSVALGVREQLLAPARMVRVAAAMGELYASATRRCVEGSSLDDVDDVSSSNAASTGRGPATGLTGGFYEVVKTLGSIKV